MNNLAKLDIVRILSSPLAKRVNQADVEKWSTSFWSIMKKQKTVSKQSFVMMFPPPNITGNLHLGHALTAALQDSLIRQRRMAGQQVYWIPGFDHAGLATQSIVEKQLLQKEGLTRQAVGREKFSNLANRWKDLKRVEMRDQLNRLGLALNYEKEYFTMDDNSSHAVQAAFKKLFDAGIIYRAFKSVYWSNEQQSTLSDIEVEKVDGVERYFRTGEPVKRRSICQWFVDANELARKSVEVVDNCSIEIIPPNYKKAWSSWLIQNGVQDWCISRQSWWGHRIPAYKLAEAPDVLENWVIADSLEEASCKLGNAELVQQDSDVLDTWFSSSLLPLTISGWPDKEKFDACVKGDLFPLDIMETGFDILNYWVSKMVMMSLALESRIPFKLILLHGMICDSEGKKMSKSKGNVIDPLDVIDGSSLRELQQRTKDQHAQGILDNNQLDFVLKNQKKLFPNGISACGADGLRAYLLSHDVQEEVVRTQIMQIEKIRRLSNKIWNIFRFAISSIESSGDLTLELDFKIEKLDQSELHPLDLQILRRLSICVDIANKSFYETFKLHHCFNSIEDFLVVNLSSDYIESLKSVLTSQEELKEERRVKLLILIKCLVVSAKLLHPFMPHITEFLYQKLSMVVNQRNCDQHSLDEMKTLGYEKFPSTLEWDNYSTELRKGTNI